MSFQGGRVSTDRRPGTTEKATDSREGSPGCWEAWEAWDRSRRRPRCRNSMDDASMELRAG